MTRSHLFFRKEMLVAGGRVHGLLQKVMVAGRAHSGGLSPSTEEGPEDRRHMGESGRQAGSGGRQSFPTDQTHGFREREDTVVSSICFRNLVHKPSYLRTKAVFVIPHIRQYSCNYGSAYFLSYKMFLCYFSKASIFFS